MKHLVLIILSIYITLPSYGWGQTGHRVTGQIAYNHLSKNARKKILGLLDGESIAMASNFMDKIKSDPAYDSLWAWHFCTIADGDSYTGPPAEGDVIEAIKKFTALLKSKKLTKTEEIFSLKCLIHLVGDIHQPLHVGNGTDKGGNDIKVSYFWQSSNLHRIWDSGIIDGQQLSYTEYTEWIDKASQSQIDRWQSDGIMEWVEESISYRSQIYDLPEDKKLSYKYDYENIATVNLRLLQAGIRLAGILDSIYG